MRRSDALPVTLALAAVLLLGGCGLFTDEDTTIRATGTVVLAETGEPLEGINVALVEDASGFGGYSDVATTETDANGRFALRYENGIERWGYNIRINSNPSDPRYTSRLFVVHLGESRDLGTIEVERLED